MIEPIISNMVDIVDFSAYTTSMARRRHHRSSFLKHKRKYRKHGAFQLKLKQQTVYTVAAIWMWLFAGIITISFFGEGTLLTSLREELNYNLGWAMYGL